MSKPKCTAKVMEVGPELIGMYYNYDEELKKSNAAILRSIKEEFARENFEKGFKVGLKRAKQRLANKEKEMVINFYKENIDLETISEICKISLTKINKIIEDYKRNLK